MASTSYKKNSQSLEEVISMFLGLVIVLVVLGLIINFVRKRVGKIDIPGIRTEKTEEIDEIGQDDQADSGKYVVERGDNLWRIAEREYGSGFEWVKIAEANDLKNPGLLAVGQELQIPEVKAAEPTIEGNTYVVEKGDNLWEIAVGAYGDGYRWVDLWQANRDKLNHPDLLEVGMELSIPR